MMEMKQEIMNDSIDDAVEEDNDEEESNTILSQVLDEIGIGLNQQVFLAFTVARRRTCWKCRTEGKTSTIRRSSGATGLFEKGITSNVRNKVN